MGHFFISGRIGLSQEVKRMKRKNRFSELLRPLGALALAGATLWTVSVTAGSTTAADANCVLLPAWLSFRKYNTGSTPSAGWGGSLV